MFVPCVRNVLAEKDDVGFEEAAAMAAARRFERLDRSGIDVGIAVRRGGG
jgi:hypothetical protein